MGRLRLAQLLFAIGVLLFIYYTATPAEPPIHSVFEGP